MNIAADMLENFRARGWRLALAESCTGGLIAAALTDVPGSSDVFDRGFVTYSNQAKTEMLGVPPAVIDQHGAVSAEVAGLMAHGAWLRAGVEVALSVTGVAGPGGGSAEKPVGLVWFGLAVIGQSVQVVSQLFPHTERADIRHAAMEFALQLLREC